MLLSKLNKICKKFGNTKLEWKYTIIFALIGFIVLSPLIVCNISDIVSSSTPTKLFDIQLPGCFWKASPDYYIAFYTPIVMSLALLAATEYSFVNRNLLLFMSLIGGIIFYALLGFLVGLARENHLKWKKKKK